MATRKEKHQRGLDKRARYLAEIEAAGLRALSRDKERRRQKELSDWQDNHDKKHSADKRVNECPHCQYEMKKERSAIAAEYKQLTPAAS